MIGPFMASGENAMRGNVPLCPRAITGGWEMRSSLKKNALRAGVVAVGAGLLMGGQSASAVWGGEGPFRFINNSSLKCLEVADWRTDDGAPVRQWDCSSGDNQQWRLADAPGGYVGQVSLINVYSGKCVYFDGGGQPVGGELLKQFTCDNTQRWSMASYGGSASRMFSVENMNMEIGGFSNAQGAPAQLWWRNSGANQQWTTQPAG
ncbi:RICIN domain-containing protein [Kitasatospora sp. NPDC059327]|uniref:RICIN domain-containing protein n=1 Tax=Kitasatospora sp. NPDC059327 TaxID=3346803 RepID=UPI0036C71BBE